MKSECSRVVQGYLDAVRVLTPREEASITLGTYGAILDSLEALKSVRSVEVGWLEITGRVFSDCGSGC